MTVESRTTSGSRSSRSTVPTCATPSTAPPPTLLADAFRTFDADADHDVAMLTGAGGTFCAGADLKAIDAGRGNRVTRRRRRPDGPDPHAVVEARHRGGRRFRGRGRARARVLVRPAGRGARRRLRRVLPALGRPPRRRRHDPAPAPHRPLARARSHPHRPRRLGRRSAAHGSRQPAEHAGRMRSPMPLLWPRSSRRCRSCVSAKIASRRTSSGIGRIADALAVEFAHGTNVLAKPDMANGVARFRAGAGRHGAND